MASKTYVSRGGEKLQFAITNYQLTINNKVCLDVGSSTGGFVDCLLQNGAAKVYSVDTAYGELAWTLRKNPKVVVMERTNILYLKSLPEQIDLVTIDASWTKLELILPIVKEYLKEKGVIVALLKPHYQTEKKNLVRGVLPAEKALAVKDEVVGKIENLKFKIENCIESPILGGGGNREYLLLISVK